MIGGNDLLQYGPATENEEDRAQSDLHLSGIGIAVCVGRMQPGPWHARGDARYIQENRPVLLGRPRHVKAVASLLFFYLLSSCLSFLPLSPPLPPPPFPLSSSFFSASILLSSFFFFLFLFFFFFFFSFF